MAVDALKTREVRASSSAAGREAASAGFLPGDIQAKVTLTAALYGRSQRAPHYETMKKYMERSHRDRPLAYMRGRTLNRSFIILTRADHSRRR